MATTLRRDLLEIGELVRRLAARAEALARDILPAGVRRGPEWVVASADSPFGCSISVHLSGGKAGVWGAWAAGKGGDALDLIAQLRFAGDKKPAIAWALEWLRIEPHAGEQLARAPICDKVADTEPSAEAKRGAAFSKWLAGRPLCPGDEAYDYLADTRGIDFAALGRVPRALRYFGALMNVEAGRPFPALLAAVIGPR